MWKRPENELPPNGTRVLCLRYDGRIVDAVRDDIWVGGFKYRPPNENTSCWAIMKCMAWTELPNSDEEEIHNCLQSATVSF